jgi:hypothetical protein
LVHSPLITEWARQASSLDSDHRHWPRRSHCDYRNRNAQRSCNTGVRKPRKLKWPSMKYGRSHSA